MLRFFILYVILISCDVFWCVIVKDELRNAPPDHVIPYSEHENPPEPSTKPKYSIGEWAKLPENVNKTSGFVPTRLIAQVRRTHTARKVPRAEAFRDAKTDEERANAGRLKEVVKKTKVNTVYTEEGYEDAAYDHAGHVRDANYNDKYKVKPKDSPKEETFSSFYRTRERNGDNPQSYQSSSSELPDPQAFTRNGIAKLEDDLKAEYEQAAKGAELQVPENLKDLASEEKSDESGYKFDESSNEVKSFENSRASVGSSEVSDLLKITVEPKSDGEIEDSDELEYSSTTPDYGNIFWKFFKTKRPERNHFDDSKLEHRSFEKHPDGISDVYESWKGKEFEQKHSASVGQDDSSVTEENSTDILNKNRIELDEPIGKQKKPYVVILRTPDRFYNYSDEGDVQKVNEKSSVVSRSFHLNEMDDDDDDNHTAIGLELPLGQVTYDNFLTYGSQMKPSESEESHLMEEIIPKTSLKPLSTVPLYRYHNQQQQKHRHPPHTLMLPPSPDSQSSYAYFNKRNFIVKPQHNLIDKNYLTKRKDVYNLPQNIFHLKRFKRSTLFNESPKMVDDVVDEELALRFPDETNENDDNEHVKHFEKGKRNEEEVEIQVPELDLNDEIETENKKLVVDKPVEPVDKNKYPFYTNTNLPKLSALKYAIHPSEIPKKTLGGMEFYNSRDRYLNCEEVDPDLSSVPERDESSAPIGDPSTSTPRLTGLGSQLLCLRDKYFDINPFDSPLFMERQLEQPEPLEDFGLEEFKSRVNKLKSEPEATVARRVSRKPEPANWKTSNHAKRHRKRVRTTTESPYQHEVYNDVMGTIKNLAHMSKRPTSSRNNSQRDATRSGSKLIDETSGRSKPNFYVRKYRLVPYRTSRVTYLMRPRVNHLGNDSNKVVSYFRTVRVHKRQTDTHPGRIETTSQRSFPSRRTLKAPANTSESLDKVVYTIRDRFKHSQPLKNEEKFGDFDNKTEVTRRNEPKYSSIRKFDADILKVNANETDDDDKAAEDPNQTEINDRYDVHENVDDRPTESPPDKTEDDESSDYSGTNEDDGEFKDPVESSQSNEDEEDKKEEDEGEEEQMEKPEKYKSDEESEEMSSSDDSSETYSGYYDEEKNAAEKSEVEKGFEHDIFPFFSPFSSYEHSGSDKKDTDDSGEDGRKFSFKFPWEEDSEDVSRYEYPWEKRKRSSKEHFNVESDEEEDEDSSESRANSSREDNDSFSSQLQPVQFDKSKIKLTTPFTPQIPATAAFTTIRSRITTPPMTSTTSRVPVYTVRSRKRPPSLTTPAMRSIRLVRGRGRGFNSTTNPNQRILNPNFNSNRRNLRLPAPSTTSKPKKTEHRSKVSKEEIITQMSFDKPENQSKQIVQKVSITMDETPERIYRTEEIDRDGVKDMIISIIPNNKTYSSDDDIERIDLKAPEMIIDANPLVADGAVQLSQHGTRHIVHSVSWTVENNYD